MFEPLELPDCDRQEQCLLCLLVSENRLFVKQTTASGCVVQDVLCTHFWLSENYCANGYVCITCWRVTESFHTFYKEIERAHGRKVQPIKNEKLSPPQDSSYLQLLDFEMPQCTIWERGSTEKLNEVYVKEHHSESDDESDNDAPDRIAPSESEAEDSEKESSLPLSKRKRTKPPIRPDMQWKRNDMRGWLPGEDLTLCRCTRGVLEAQCHVCYKKAGPSENRADLPYMRFAALMRHFAEKHASSGYAVCCNRKYARRRSLKAHMRTHGKVTLYHCHVCRIQFRKQETLDAHNTLLHMADAEKPFRCEKCSKGFANEGLLTSHQEWHQNVEERNISCSDCNIFFPSIPARLKHRKLHHPTPVGTEVPVLAELALVDDPADMRLIKSEYRTRLTAEEMTAQNTVIERICTLSCNQCEFVAALYDDLKQHAQESHRMRTVPVFCCDQPYTNRLRLYEHCLCHDEPDRFRCPVCGKKYANSRSLLNHQRRIHTPASERPFHCDVCGETFVKDYLLKKHLSYHLAKHQKLNHCEECERSFATAAALKCHRQTYHGALASSICDICAKGFNSRSLLEAHRLTHSAEGKSQLKHQCERCQRWLRNKKSYQQHRSRCHANTGPVSCKFCGKESVNSIALKAHVKLHHDERPEHACTHCQKSFKTPLRLREHEATHTGTVLYRCPWCPRTFACGSNMYKHKKAGHPAEWAAGVRRRFGER